MQATSTPTIARPKLDGLATGLVALALGVGIAAGAAIGQQFGSTSTVTPVAGYDVSDQATGAAQAHRNGETGALSPAQRSLAEQRRGEIGARAATKVVYPPRLDDDQMSHYNNIGRSQAAGARVNPSTGVVIPTVEVPHVGGIVWTGTYPGAPIGSGDGQGNDTPVGTSHR